MDKIVAKNLVNLLYLVETCCQNNQELEKNPQQAVLIKNECTSQLPMALQHYSQACQPLMQPVDVQRDSLKNLPRTLVIKERVWGLKIGDKLIYDLEDYAFESVLRKAQSMPMAKVFSDREFSYFLNGDRQLAVTSPKSWVNTFRGRPFANMEIIDLNQLQGMGISDFDYLNDQYPQVKNNRWLFLIDPEDGHYFLVMDEISDSQMSFADYLEGRIINSEDSSVKRTDNIGNLQQTFKWIHEILEKGNYSALSENPEFSTCTRKRYQERADGTHRCKESNLRFLVGYPDLPFAKAKLLVKDKAALRMAFLNGQKEFCITQDGYMLSPANVVTSKYYQAGREDIILVPKEVYARWGREFSPAIKELLQRERKFDYKFYSHKLVSQLSGKNADNLFQHHVLGSACKELGSVVLKVTAGTAAACIVGPVAVAGVGLAGSVVSGVGAVAAGIGSAVTGTVGTTVSAVSGTIGLAGKIIGGGASLVKLIGTSKVIGAVGAGALALKVADECDLFDCDSLISIGSSTIINRTYYQPDPTPQYQPSYAADLSVPTRRGNLTGWG